ncbi:hypothetical protein HMH01_04810 [Halovulum dunhuangense]|uniref:Tetratricopeptide repeat protein n=1 Tax=Halovulum dunhuangense TaxID=1505036 RepID=A0A849L0G3_9RHOB|nr:hypothetical protein [Halovulum dunhuangense]NNU79758.1 hypothetical protein [Halovulum dunhuangense]
MRPLLLALVPFLAGPALAACPPVDDRADLRAELLTGILNAGSEAEARQLSDRLWQVWTTAPDSFAQSLLDRGMSRREAYDFAAAEEIFDELIAYCPDYVEGYNQRAFIRFLRENYDGSLADLDVVLAADPFHFAALSGRALNLMRQGRMDLGQQALRDALRLNPWLPERNMLIPQPGDRL